MKFPKPPSITPNDIDKKFQTLDPSLKSYWRISKICENMKNLVSKKIISTKFLDIMDLNHKKYRDFLIKRDLYLERHQVMDAEQFSQLFWDNSLQSKKINNNKFLVSGKYNKSDINQGKLCLCTFDTFLKQLKETPFFETLMRCSLERNKKDNWWKCLIPFCNNEWKYVEVSDEEINYLRQTKIWENELISCSSLWFNILETIFVKLYWSEESTLNEVIGSKKYDNFMSMDPQDLKDSIPWSGISQCYRNFLWINKFQFGRISDTTEDEIESIINLIKTWIIKLGLSDNTFTTSKDGKFIEVSAWKFKWLKYGNTIIKKNITKWANLKILNDRWYSIDLIHEAWPNEEISIWRSPQLGFCFMIKGTDEWFVPWHEYSIEGMYKNGDEMFVTIINPRYTWKKINIPLKYMELFWSIHIVKIDMNQIFTKDEKENKEVK